MKISKTLLIVLLVLGSSLSQGIGSTPTPPADNSTDLGVDTDVDVNDTAEIVNSTVPDQNQTQADELDAIIQGLPDDADAARVYVLEVQANLTSPAQMAELLVAFGQRFNLTDDQVVVEAAGIIEFAAAEGAPAQPIAMLIADLAQHLDLNATQVAELILTAEDFVSPEDDVAQLVQQAAGQTDEEFRPVREALQQADAQQEADDVDQEAEDDTADAAIEQTPEDETEALDEIRDFDQQEQEDNVTMTQDDEQFSDELLEQGGEGAYNYTGQLGIPVNFTPRQVFQGYVQGRQNLTKQRLEYLLRGYPVIERVEALEEFAAYDTDQDGVLTFDEFRPAAAYFASLAGLPVTSGLQVIYPIRLTGVQGRRQRRRLRYARKRLREFVRVLRRRICRARRRGDHDDDHHHQHLHAGQRIRQRARDAARARRHHH